MSEMNDETERQYQLLAGIYSFEEDESLIDFVKQAVTERFLSGKPLIPTVFLDVSLDPGGKPVPHRTILSMVFPNLDDDGKSTMLLMTRHMARKHAAKSVTLVVETWEVMSNRPEAAADPEDFRDQLPDNLGDHPDAKESVNIIHESVTSRTWLYAHILRDKAEVSLAPWDTRDAMWISGRFASLMPHDAKAIA